jgi:2-polyprenyl-3-methyl-5-hydroxy-6-metoxy-1,4-benzoquinol methylase
MKDEGLGPLTPSSFILLPSSLQERQIGCGRRTFDNGLPALGRKTMNTAGVAKDREDRAFLNQIAKLSFDRRRWTRESLLDMRDFLGPWNHNIRLPFGVYTAGCAEYYPAHQEILAVVNHQLGGHFKGKRILDVGCLEGYFSAECAIQGATVLGIDGKTLNVKKCEFVKSALGIRTLKFVRDDAMKVTRRKYGSFEVVLALGFLYHLEDPFKFLANVADLCDGFVLIDTLVALADQPPAIGDDWKPDLSALREFKVGGKTYSGRWFREFSPGESQAAKDLSPTASLKNDLSVWLTEDSLVSLLRDVGFEQISKLVFPKKEAAWWSDLQVDSRVLILAVRHRKPFRSMIFRGSNKTGTGP